MKCVKKITVLLLSILVVFGCAAVAFAGGKVDTDYHSGVVNVITYNVGGLPIPSHFDENKRVVPADMKQIGKALAKENYDIIAVQEDFNWHAVLSANIHAKYASYTSGGVPAGSGLNLFSRLPIYNVEHIAWDLSCGIFDKGSDELTPKGIQYCTIELEKGVYLDFYNIHTDGYEDEGSLEARVSNLKQISDLIHERSQNRPVVVTGDFNARLSRDYDKLYETLIKPSGLKDAWAEIENNGDYFPAYDGNFNNWWGRYDSVDRILYRDGGGVSLKALDHQYKWYYNEAGRSLSDHGSAQAKLMYTYTETSDSDSELKKPVPDILGFIENYIYKCLRAIYLMITDLPTLFA